MILGLDTSTPECRVSLDGRDYRWDADRTLAHGLLGYLEDCLKKEEATFDDLTGIAVFRGPGSFTGLRIGITVANTIASAQGIPIVGETGDDWLARARARLQAGEDDRIILPEYGSAPHITQPKK